MLQRFPILSRFLSKLVCDYLPATIASAVGAVLLSQYGRPPATTPPPVVMAPASTEMMQMARDEHARIVEFLKKTDDSRRAADQAVEEEAVRMKAAERNAALAARSAKSAESKVATLTAVLAGKPEKKASPKPAARPFDEADTAGEPLQLLVPISTSSPAASGAGAQPARKNDGFLQATWRETSTAVEKIPAWVRGAVDRISDNLPSLQWPEVRARQFF